MRIMAITFLLVTVGCDVRPVTNKAANHVVTLKDFERLQVEEGIVVPTQFQSYGAQFFVVDPIGEQTYLFDPVKKQTTLIGGRSQAPGEYFSPTAMTVTEDRIWIACSATMKLHSYARDGSPLKDVALPVKDLVTSLHALPDGSLLATIFSRYSKHWAHQFSPDGELIRSFGDQPEEFNYGLDTFSPAGSVILSGDSYFQNFNFKYAITIFDGDWNVIERKMFTSSRYIPAPSIQELKPTIDHRQELKLHGQFTQFNGISPLGDRFVTSLIGWKDKDTPYGILEFWDKDFQSLGYAETRAGETFLGTHESKLVFYDVDQSLFIFRELADEPAQEM